MKNKLFSFAMAAALVSTVLPNYAQAADTSSSKGVKVYELTDSSFVVPERSSNDFVDDLTKESAELVKNSPIAVPVIVYELDGSVTMPSVDMEEVNVLKDILPTTRGNSIPTTFHNLSNSDYYYSFSNMKNYTYTNAYFNTNTNGYISMSTNGIDAGGNSITILMYELLSNNLVHSWTGDPQSIAGLGFYGNSSKTYYFKFESYNGYSVTGSGTIFHE